MSDPLSQSLTSRSVETTYLSFASGTGNWNANGLPPTAIFSMALPPETQSSIEFLNISSRPGVSNSKPYKGRIKMENRSNWKWLCEPYCRDQNQEMLQNILLYFKNGLIWTAIEIEIRKTTQNYGNNIANLLFYIDERGRGAHKYLWRATCGPRVWDCWYRPRFCAIITWILWSLNYNIQSLGLPDTSRSSGINVWSRNLRETLSKTSPGALSWDEPNRMNRLMSW